MAAESGANVHDSAPPAAALRRGGRGLADWSKLDAEAERWGIEVRRLSREGLKALIKSSTRERSLPPSTASCTRKLATSCGGAGVEAEVPLPSTARPYFWLLARFRWGRVEL